VQLQFTATHRGRHRLAGSFSGAQQRAQIKGDNGMTPLHGPACPVRRLDSDRNLPS
jgi:hypothetical protein